jgi:hypothetical protein
MGFRDDEDFEERYYDDDVEEETENDDENDEDTLEELDVDDYGHIDQRRHRRGDEDVEEEDYYE